MVREAAWYRRENDIRNLRESQLGPIENCGEIMKVVGLRNRSDDEGNAERGAMRKIESGSVGVLY